MDGDVFSERECERINCGVDTVEDQATRSYYVGWHIPLRPVHLREGLQLIHTLLDALHGSHCFGIISSGKGRESCDTGYSSCGTNCLMHASTNGWRTCRPQVAPAYPIVSLQGRVRVLHSLHLIEEKSLKFVALFLQFELVYRRLRKHLVLVDVLMLVHEVINVIGLKEIFLVELGSTTGFHQRILRSRSTLVVHNWATLYVVSPDGCTFPSRSVLGGHQPFLALQDDQVTFELLLVLGGIYVIRVPPAAHYLGFHFLSSLALALQDTRCIQPFDDLGWILEDSIRGRLEASVA